MPYQIIMIESIKNAYVTKEEKDEIYLDYLNDIDVFKFI